MMKKSNGTLQISPTRFVVESHERRDRQWVVLFVLSSLILVILFALDPNVRKDPLWVAGGLALGLVLVETAPVNQKCQLLLDISPMGIQRSSVTNDQRKKYLPLLPRESIQDCLLVEHVEAWSVSTHLVFRMRSSKSGTLVPVFPNATLSFEQCHTLLRQIQTAMQET